MGKANTVRRETVVVRLSTVAQSAGDGFAMCAEVGPVFNAGLRSRLAVRVGVDEHRAAERAVLAVMQGLGWQLCGAEWHRTTKGGNKRVAVLELECGVDVSPSVLQATKWAVCARTATVVAEVVEVGK